MGPKTDKNKYKVKGSEPDMEEGIFVTQQELDAMVQRAVQAATESLSQDITRTFNAKIADLDRRQSDSEALNLTLQNKIDSYERQLNQLSAKVEEQCQLISNFKEKLQECTLWANRNEQYSRKNNLKITGWKVNENEKPILAVSRLLREKLGMQVKDGDIDVAHPLPVPKHSGIPNAGSPPLLVKFKHREPRNEAISRRTQLKNSGCVIQEDLTALNIRLMNRLHNHELISRSWAWNGRIYGLTKSGIKIKFQPFDDVEAKVSAISDADVSHEDNNA